MAEWSKVSEHDFLNMMMEYKIVLFIHTYIMLPWHPLIIKALVLGTSLHWRGFESHRHQFLVFVAQQSSERNPVRRSSLLLRPYE